MNPVFIVGCGDIGQRIARLYQQRYAPAEFTVYGLARSEASEQRLRAAAITPVVGDLARPASLRDMPTALATVFYLAPPPAEGDTDPLLRHFLAAIDGQALPEKMVLLSTTAVYGDCHGDWITEQQPPNPQTARGRRRRDAEQAALQWSRDSGVPLVILRVGGIYGPGRLPLARLQQGLPILREAESPFTNRIHQDDLAQICVAAAERGKAGEVYNVADGEPSTMAHYFKAVAAACALPAPPEVTLAEAQQVMSAGMLSYLKESRRLDTRKLRDELGVQLQYPSLAAGLQPLVSSSPTGGQ
jgi:nucleoside-diphosphate-sugar epimerase